jgi:hypothetical protein
MTIDSYFKRNDVGNKFFPFDIFRGVDETRLADEELINVRISVSATASTSIMSLVKNFTELKDNVIAHGSVPDTASVNIDRVAYLSIDNEQRGRGDGHGAAPRIQRPQRYGFIIKP